MHADVAQMWARILNWLTVNAPGVVDDLKPPAQAAAVDAVVQEVGRPLPDDLVAWWQLVGGVTQRSGTGVFPGSPGFWPYSPEDALDSRRQWLETMAEFDNDVEESGQAGDPAYTFQLPFLPIGTDGAGQDLYVDLRAGQQRGCVTMWDIEFPGRDLPRWPSVGAMLADVADAMTYGTPALTAFAARMQAEGFEENPVRLAVVNREQIDWQRIE
jgi:cell wall assembly regulator SMI1